jgi:hypothetical protein
MMVPSFLLATYETPLIVDDVAVILSKFFPTSSFPSITQSTAVPPFAVKVRGRTPVG